MTSKFHVSEWTEDYPPPPENPPPGEWKLAYPSLIEALRYPDKQTAMLIVAAVLFAAGTCAVSSYYILALNPGW